MNTALTVTSGYAESLGTPLSFHSPDHHDTFLDALVSIGVFIHELLDLPPLHAPDEDRLDEVERAVECFCCGLWDELDEISEKQSLQLLADHGWVPTTSVTPGGKLYEVVSYADTFLLELLRYQDHWCPDFYTWHEWIEEERV